MDLENLKAKLIQKISSCNDENTLQEIQNLLSTYEVYSEKVQEEKSVYTKNKSTDTVEFILNNDQMEAVQEAREEYAKGKWISDEENSEYFEKWLKK